MTRRAALSMWYFNVLVVATCGLVYELLAGTLASYVMGDSVLQFSLTIGTYISSMGVGAYLSRYIERQLVRMFIDVELAVALCGGLSAPLLFLAFGRSHHFYLVLFALIVVIGVLVGLELPLLLRILEKEVDFKDLVSRILSVDYLGGLLASLLFPLLCVPNLGLVRTSVCFGLINAAVAAWGTVALKEHLPARAQQRVYGAVVASVLVAAWIHADKLTLLAEEGMFSDAIIYTRNTPYQRIVITRGRAGFQLFLNGNLQFASADEARYHESLAHVPMLAHGAARKILILGGGDGLALREILRWPQVAQVTLVDLDPDMTRLSERFAPLQRLNEGAFSDPRVQVVNADAMTWLADNPGQYDVALVDFPDPNNFALGKLYTRSFYKLLRARLRPDGVAAVQSTSPLFARASFWCIVRTLEAAGFATLPYHVAVPSFGEWGFTLVRNATGELSDTSDTARWAPSISLAAAPEAVTGRLRYLNDAALRGLFDLPADMQPLPVEVNRLDNQTLVRTYEHEWRHWD